MTSTFKTLIYIYIIWFDHLVLVYRGRSPDFIVKIISCAQVATKRNAQADRLYISMFQSSQPFKNQLKQLIITTPFLVCAVEQGIGTDICAGTDIIQPVVSSDAGSIYRLTVDKSRYTRRQQSLTVPSKQPGLMRTQHWSCPNM